MEHEIELGSLAINLFLVLLLVLLNGVFVAAEFSLVKVRHSRLQQLNSEGNRLAPYALKVANRLDAYLSATQLGITLTSLGLGWLGEPAVSELLVEPLMYQMGFTDETLIAGVSVAIGFAIITFLHIVLGELAPKSLAIQKSEGTSLVLAGPLLVFYYVFLPVIWLLNHAANAFLRLFGLEPAGEAEAAHSEEEIRILMNQSAKSGAIDLEEVKLMDNIFDFSDMLAREVMLPRTDMDCLYVNLPLKENLKIITETRHSRYPVAIEDKDRIIGFVHITDILLWPQGTEPNLRKLVRPILNVPESMEISHVLRLMQQKRAQLTLVVDEYGGTAGLLTAEEILEEIVGDLYDEFENERPEIEVVGDVISVDGRLLIEDVNDLTGAEIDDEEVDSIGGWMFKELEGNPLPGQKVEFGGITFEVAEAERLRITRVHIHKPHTDAEVHEQNGEENERGDD
ncbi:hemolysin family protein [Saccharibacillus brassicae]|uniref:HlyC/CorC family transporter n=1 Tax=Saccharibacillus brassicae TaxID=2583377 RepID=A0A4Y6UXT8_SACBS|nr:hemolysin family protein [Saccharibacillus brassicae]QDH22559.1 HlyC/CorC family transporter [Saccharibacillus brassicae]